MFSCRRFRFFPFLFLSIRHSFESIYRFNWTYSFFYRSSYVCVCHKQLLWTHTRTLLSLFLPLKFIALCEQMVMAAGQRHERMNLSSMIYVAWPHSYSHTKRERQREKVNERITSMNMGWKMILGIRFAAFKCWLLLALVFQYWMLVRHFQKHHCICQTKTQEKKPKPDSLDRLCGLHRYF